MILPNKHLSPDRAIITVASEILTLINNRSTVSSVWNEFRERQKKSMRQGEIPYDWYVLSLDFLYLIGSIEECNGRLSRVDNNAL